MLGLNPGTVAHVALSGSRRSSRLLRSPHIRCCWLRSQLAHAAASLGGAVAVCRLESVAPPGSLFGRSSQPTPPPAGAQRLFGLVSLSRALRQVLLYVKVAVVRCR